VLGHKLCISSTDIPAFYGSLPCL